MNKTATQTLPSPTRPPRAFRVAAAAALVGIFLVAASWLVLLSRSQWEYARSLDFLRQGRFSLAVERLEKARFMGGEGFQRSRELGRAWLGLAKKEPSSGEQAFLAATAMAWLQKAVRENPLDAASRFYLAQSLLPAWRPKDPSAVEQTLEAFQQAIRLRPHSIRYHIHYARFLHQREFYGEVVSQVENLASIYPPGVLGLQKEAFWSPAAARAARRGLEKAVRQHLHKRRAQRALSILSKNAGDWPAALDNLILSVSPRFSHARAEDFYELGFLYLKNSQPELAKDQFLSWLSRTEWDSRSLQRVLSEFRSTGNLEDFAGFFKQAQDLWRMSPASMAVLAGFHNEQGRPDQALLICEQAGKQGGDAELLYQQARAQAALDRPEEAVKSLEKALALEANHGPSLRLYRQLSPVVE